MKYIIIILLSFYSLSYTQHAASGGRFKPSQNNPGEFLRALVVFVQFDNDKSDVANWSYGKLPNYANNIFDNDVSKKYRDTTLSDYFHKMSNGKFDFIADVYPELVRLKNDNQYGQSNLQVLEEINKKIKNFKKYDNWKFEKGKFVFNEEKGDSILDMIFIIYRNTENKSFGIPGGIAGLGFSKDFITHDNIKINGSSVSVKGSGVTSIVRNKMHNAYTIVPHLAHEFGHYLFGAGHTRVSGLMVGDPYGYWGGTFAMSSWERNFLGYNNFQDANKDGYTKELKDFVTTGDAIRVTIPFNNPSSGEYLLIENHQRKSLYDKVISGGALEGDWRPNYNIGKGVYVWYVSNGNNFPPNVVSVQADGAWEWNIAEQITMPEGWPPTLSAIKRGKPNIYLNTGKGDRNADILGMGKPDRWHDVNPLTKKMDLSRDVMGDETDAFNINYNKYLTPWSNPSTSKFEKGKEILTNIAIELVEQKGDIITIKVFGTNESALQLPPSKPQQLTVTEKNKHPFLSWIPNKEPDVQKYRIYKSESSGDEPKDFKLAAEVNHSNSPSINWSDDKISLKGGNKKVFYKVTAMDKSGKESQQSDYDWIAQ